MSISSVKDGVPHDSTCYLNIGDHPFITQRSFVAYALALVKPAQAVIDGVARREYHDQGLLDEGVMQRVLAGVMTSPQVRPRIRGLCR